MIELMIVVAIIGITAALAGPAIARAMAISRADRANHDLIRLIRFGRSQSMAFGRAYLVHFNNAGDGRFELWQGATSACRRENWAVTMSVGTCSAAAGSPTQNCVDFVDSATYVVGSYRVALASPANVEVCFQPNGDAYTRPVGGGPFAIPASGIITFTTTRYEGATTPDPQRGVIIPVGGAPRAMR